MAVSLKDIYAYITGASASYPWGSFKNASAPGALDGTPFEKQWANDVYGFLQALLSKAGLVPSGAPDTAEASQYLQAIQYLIAQSTPVATTIWGFWAAAPAGYLECQGGTIGDGASGASVIAGATAQPLFTALWAIPGLTLYDSVGNAVARGGSAAADWAAHRRVAIPDMRGRFPRGWDHGAGVDAYTGTRALGSYQLDAQQNITGAFLADDVVSANVNGAFYKGAAVNYDADSRGGGGAMVEFDASRQVRIADEVRPKNMAAMWVIKY